MLPEPLTSIVEFVDQDLERVYAEWCLEVEHPDLAAFVEHLITWQLITVEQGREVLNAANPNEPNAAESVFSIAEPSESEADDPPTVKDDRGPGRVFEDPTSASIDIAATPGVQHEEGSVEEFDLFDEADMATVHDSAWPGRPVESDEVDFPADDDSGSDGAAVEAAGEAESPPESEPVLDGPGPVPVLDPPDGPEPLTPFNAPADDPEEGIGDLETVIKKTAPVDLGELETLVRKKGDDQDLKSMITVVPPTPKADFDADTVQPVPRLEETRASPEAWGSGEGEADDTDTVTQAPPELAADLLEGILEDEPDDEADAATHVDDDESSEGLGELLSDESVPPALAETRVPARRGDDKIREDPAPAVVASLTGEAARTLKPMINRLRNEPRLRTGALVAGGLLVFGIIGVAWMMDTWLTARAGQRRQSFVKAVTVGALQASRLESALVAGIGPLDATATLVTEALENGPRWRPVKGRPPGEFRSENTLPETGFAVDRSPDKTQGPRWVDPMTPAVFSPEVELQNPRWGALSEVFQRHLPPMINDRGAVGAVWVGLEDGFYITLPGRGIDGDLDPRNDPVYRGARTAASSVDWTADSYGRLTVARPLVAPDAESAFLGVVAVEFDAEWVIDHLLPRPLVGVPGVGSLLLDDGPMIVAATELEEAKAINPTLLEGMDEVDPETTSGYRIVRDGNGQELLYIHHRLTSMGWTHVIYGPLERLTATPEPVVPGVGAPADG